MERVLIFLIKNLDKEGRRASRDNCFRIDLRRNVHCFRTSRPKVLELFTREREF